MKWPAVISLVIVSLTSLFYSTVPAKAPAPGWLSVTRDGLCVTEGVIQEAEGNRLSVNVPKMRAYLNRRTAQGIEARFTYLGPTAAQSALASGEMRRQFGLKLRAQDGCNLVYAMWRFEPESKLVVSVKSNPNEHTSSECGNRGYRNIKARRTSPVPLVHPGESHTIRAEMNAAEMAVFIDGTLAWEGNVGPEIISSDGPVGVRSDNARLDLEVRARQKDNVHHESDLGCKSETGGSD
jgi:hypothetical protein